MKGRRPSKNQLSNVTIDHNYLCSKFSRRSFAQLLLIPLISCFGGFALIERLTNLLRRSEGAFLGGSPTKFTELVSSSPAAFNVPANSNANVPAEESDRREASVSMATSLHAHGCFLIKVDQAKRC